MQVWSNFVVSNNGACTCCNGAAAACTLTLPTVLIDGTSTQFSNSTAAQNFFDNSGALIGCTAIGIFDPPCDCLVEANSNNGSFVTSVNATGGTFLDLLTSKTTNGGGTGFHNFLWKASFTAPPVLNVSIVVGTTETGSTISANISLYDSAMTYVTSNVISNANINSGASWSTWQNLSANSAGEYHIYTNYSVTSPSGSKEITYNPNYTCPNTIDICELRAAYDAGGTTDYIYCQSA